MNQAALLNHLWQSTAFGLVAAGVAWGLRRHQAWVRFWVWMAASLKFLVPFAALAELGRMIPWPAAVTPAPALAALSAPFQPRLPAVTAMTLTMNPAASVPASGHALFFWLVVASLGVSAMLAARWALAWTRLARIARAARPERRGTLEVGVTVATVEPGVFGIVRPVILLPQGIEQRLSREQLDAVLAHECWHIARRDNLWAALHMVVESLFWFHPLVWFTGSRLVAERERACDEAVLRAGGEREVYARGLIEVGRFYAEAPLACAAGITGGGLRERVREVMVGSWGLNLSRRARFALGGLGAAALIGPLAAGAVFGQAAAPKRFDAASITVAKPPSGGEIFMGLRDLPTRLIAQNMSLKDLVVAAYGLKPYQVIAPNWMSGERFDVTAEVQQPLDRNTMNSLLKPFLAEQFRLKTHNETRTMAVYYLGVAKGGAKLKAATGEELPAMGRGRAEMLAGRMAAPAGRGPMMRIRMGPQGAQMQGISNISGLVNLVSQQLGKPVIDRTGLTGTYDYKLNFMPDMRAMGMGGGMPPPLAKGEGRRGGPRMNGQSGAPGNEVAAPAPDLITAIQEQLGLTVTQGKGPVELLVIDSASKMPVGN